MSAEDLRVMRLRSARRHVYVKSNMNYSFANKRGKYSNAPLTNSDSKKLNLGSCGKRKVKISLAKVNIGREGE